MFVLLAASKAFSSPIIMNLNQEYKINLKDNVIGNVKAENAQKDIIIASLKKQLYELKDREHQFIPLENEVTTIESRYDMLQQEKERIENENKIKIQINRKSITELRTEVDSLKLQIHKSSVSIEEVLRDINNIKRTCENRENEIAALLASNQEINSKNEQLTQDNRGQSGKIKNLKQDRNKLDLDSQKLLKSLQESINLLKVLQKEARTLEASNSRLGSILGVAQKDHSQLLQQMKNREEVVITTHKKLDALNLEIDTLREKTKKLQKQCLKSEEQFKTTSDSLQVYIGKNKDQAKRIKIYQSELRSIENELDKSILERDALENDHEMLVAENQDLNEQIAKIFQQINQYQKLNNQLQQEIQNYILIDEQARRMLDRKDNMLNLVESASRRILTTADNIAHLR